MTDEKILEIFARAWGSIEKDTIRSQYTHHLRKAISAERTRELICEFLAEACCTGAKVEFPELAGEGNYMAFWRLLNSDWRKMRDLCLLAGV